MSPHTELTAEAFERALRAMQSDDELRYAPEHFEPGRKAHSIGLKANR